MVLFKGYNYYLILYNMKARILDTNEFGGLYTEEFIEQFPEAVEGWVFTCILPNLDNGIPEWDGSEWVNYINTTSIPTVLTNRQLRIQLVIDGYNLNDIVIAINQLPEPDKSIALIEWDYANTFERDNTLLNAVAIILNLNDTDVDNIFINGSQR